jgi:hypothetical protein
LNYAITIEPSIHPVDLIVVRLNLADIRNDYGDRTTRRQIHRRGVIENESILELVGHRKERGEEQ